MLISRRLISAFAIVALAAAMFWTVPQGHAQERITVFAAASLKNALDSINASWKTETGKEATISYAGSSALAKQIEQGAPADVFVSADVPWMDYLRERSLIKADTERLLLGNRLVLVAPADSTATIEIVEGFDLEALLGDGRLAMANVDSVPAGKYGKEALENLGAWSNVQDKLAQAENVRAALALVSTGEAPLGIVYQTDAAADSKVKIIATFPEESHAPIEYPAAVIAESSSADAQTFLDYLETPQAEALFEEQGFTVLGDQASQ